MRTEADKLGKRLRSALSRSGIVEGYLHLCRRCKRRGTPHEEKHVDCERRHCPKCKMLLWARALPRRFRLHDTRHTTATLLLAAGVDLYAVARILRHSDPKVTFETYAHLVPGYLHAQIDRLPKLEKFAALVLQEAPKALEAPRGQLQEGPDSRVVQLARLAGVEPAARGFEGRMRRSQGIAGLRNRSQVLGTNRARIPGGRRFSHRFPRILRTGCGRY